MPPKQSTFTKCLPKHCYSGKYFSGRPAICKKSSRPQVPYEEEYENPMSAYMDYPSSEEDIVMNLEVDDDEEDDDDWLMDDLD